MEMPVSRHYYLPVLLAIAVAAGCTDTVSVAPEGPRSSRVDATSGPKDGVLAVTPDSAELVAGDTLQLSAVASGAAANNGAKVSWSSSDESIASISSEGLVTAMGAGRAVITAKRASYEAEAVILVEGSGDTPTDSSPPDSSSPPDTTSSEPPPSSPPPGEEPPPPGTYSATSPHWSHIRTMVTDFYYNWTSALRDTAAGRFDFVMSGNRTEWKTRNPGVKYIPYQLHWSVMQDPKYPAIGELENWYAANTSCNIENAFLHNSGTSKTKANRKVTTIWGTARWMYNPSDECWRRFQRWRLQKARDAGSDGVFYDEYGTGIMGPAVNSLELGSTAAAYHNAIIETLKQERAAFPGFIIMINSAEYVTTADIEMIEAAGATHLELWNDILYGGAEWRWGFTEARLAAGVLVEVVGRRNWRYGLPSSVTKGNYRDATLDGFPAPGMYRAKMGELAAYYMMRPLDPSKFYFDDNNDNWSVSPTAHWMPAKQVDVGNPVEARRLIADATGSDGQRVKVWRREYTKSLILVRPAADWNESGYGDASAYTVQLPTNNTWRMLRHDGTLSSNITSVALRKGEAVILMKGSPN